MRHWLRLVVGVSALCAGWNFAPARADGPPPWAWGFTTPAPNTPPPARPPGPPRDNVKLFSVAGSKFQFTETPTRRQPPYAVILHNDDTNTMVFVIAVLRKVFGYTAEKCVQLMLEAHEKGRAVVWIGALEVAELKADQIRSCGADPLVAKGGHPLGVSVEPAA